MSGKSLKRFEREFRVTRMLRHRISREYFKNGGWTPNPEEASSFADVLEAARTCNQYGLTNVEIALRCQSAKADVFCTPIR